MPLVRTVAMAGASAVCSFVLLHAASCGTDAVGIEDCREIETARCEAAVHCEGALHVDDVGACKRFYRDQCLHGLAVDDEPGAPALDLCVSAIEAAGDCAALDPDMTVADCIDHAVSGGRIDSTNLQRDLTTVCDIVRYPERAWECEFLQPRAPEPPDAGTAGSAGQGGGSAGAGTAGGGG